MKCPYCARSWVPRLGVDAARSFCGACSEERRERSRDHFARRQRERFEREKTALAVVFAFDQENVIDIIEVKRT
jgi:hypothetical protein